MNKKKLGPNLSFTAENKMGNLQKGGHISSNFKNLSINWLK